MIARTVPLLVRLVPFLLFLLGASHPAAADGGKMVFASSRNDYNYELYLMNLDGTGLERLTYCGATDSEPSLSRDGSKVVFVSFRDEPGGEIYSINVDGTELRRLTHNRRDDSKTFIGTDSNPTWNPDGTQIAFYSWIDSSTPGLYKMNADGSGLTRLTDATSGQVSWSPDGTRITYQKSNGGVLETWVVDADGTNARFLSSATRLCWVPDGTALVGTTYFAGFNIVIVDPADGQITQVIPTAYAVNSVVLSADGQKAIFSGSVDVQKSELYSINLNGTGLARLTSNPEDDIHPSCAPGTTSPVPPAPTGFGRLLLTNSDALYTMNPTGWDIRKLPQAESIPNLLYQHARWSPDGSRISFQSGTNIYVMDADGTNVRKLPKPDESYLFEGPATWSADGQKLAFAYSYTVSGVTHRSILVVSGFDTGSQSSFNLTGTASPHEYWPEWNPQNDQILFWVNDDLPRLVTKGGDSPVSPELIVASSPETAVYPKGPYYQRGVWNATGDRIIFTRSESATAGTREELLMVNADGSNLRYLTEHDFGEASDDNPTVSPNSSLSDLNLAFMRNIKGSTSLYTLRRTASDPDSPEISTEIQRITFDQQNTSDGDVNSPQSVHWGANFDYTTPDNLGPLTTITTPEDGGSLKLTKVEGSATDPGSDPSGVAIVWVKFQRMSDSKFWNPAASDESEKWSTNPVLLPASISFSGGDLKWAITQNLPSSTDAPPGAQYRVTAFAVDSAGNAGVEVMHTFTMQEPGSLTFAKATAEAYESAGYIDLLIRREGGTDGDVSVDYNAFSGLAMEGEDFFATSGTLSFADGETEKTVRVNLIQDDVSEGRETFFVQLNNPAGGAMLGAISSALVDLLEAPFGIALDAPGFEWSTDSTYGLYAGGWWTTTSLSHSGGASAMITPMYSAADHWIETSVAGPGTLTFYWKVSSEPNGDRLILLLDGTQQAEISGEVGWAKYTLQIPAGAHTVRWNFSTNANGLTEGQNTAWLDSVQFTAGTGGGEGDPGSKPDARVFAGTYHGLVQSMPSSSLTSGFVSLKVTKKGAFTGKLSLGKTKIPLKGRVDSAGIATIKPQKKKPDVGLQLVFDESGTGNVTGTATAQNEASLSMFAHRLPVFTTKQPSPHAGNYTVLLPADQDQGTGFGTLKVSKTGSAKLAMKLPDGTTASHGASISANGEWPLHGTFGKTGGALLGWVEFQDIPGQSDFSGELEWFSFPTLNGTGSATETIIEVRLDGSRYTPPANGGALLPSLAAGGIADLSLSNGVFETPTSLEVLLRSVRKTKVSLTLAAENPYRVKLKVNPKNGSFSGSFKLPESKGRVPFNGVLFQKQNRGAGFHRKSGVSGEVELTPVFVE